MTYFIKKIIASNIILYKLWFKVMRSKIGDRVVLPKKGDKLYFDGYPRSGNTYLLGMIHFFFPGAIKSSHLHSIAPIKIAIRKDISCVIIFRDPKNCVASNQFRKTNGKFVNHDLLNNQLRDYIEYYRYVLKMDKYICLVNFEDVKSIPALILNRINKRFELRQDLVLDENQIQEYDKFISEKESSKKTASGSLPNKEREKYKKDIFDLIEKNKNYPVALKIHKELVHRANQNC